MINSATSAVSVFQSVRPGLSRKIRFEDSGADPTERPRENMSLTDPKASCHTASDVFGFVRRANNRQREKVMAELLSKGM